MKTNRFLAGVLAALLAASSFAVTAAAEQGPTGITGNGVSVPEVIQLYSSGDLNFPTGDSVVISSPEPDDEDIAYALSYDEEENKQTAEPIKLNASVKDYFRNDYTKSYLYNCLSSDQQKLYVQLYNICEDILYSSRTYTTKKNYNGCGYSIADARSISTYGLSQSQLDQVTNAFVDDNPQFFFLYFIGCDASYKMSWIYIYDKFNTPDSRAQVINAVANKMDSHYDFLTSDEDEVFKEQYIATLMCDSVSYDYTSYDAILANDYSAIWSNQTIAGYFLNDTVVCNGYADTFMYMCRLAGISCVFDTKEGVHAWNRVNIKNNWYVTDVTWMDQGSAEDIYYDYFNNSYSTVKKVDGTGAHDSTYTAATLPECVLDSHYASGQYRGSGTSTFYTYNTYSKNNNGFSFVKDAPVYMTNIPGEGSRLDRIEIYENNVLKGVSHEQKMVYTMGDSDVFFDIYFAEVDRSKIEAFVDRLYTIILDRPAESAGLADWTNALISGKNTSADIVYGLANSDEFKNKGLSNDEVIERMYRAMLGRASDASGKADWLDAMANGCTVNGIINGFSGSEEFENICSGFGISAGSITSCEARDKNVNLTAFVSRMYTKALGRAYDVSGLNDWTGDYLDGKKSANDIAYGFILSQEFEGRNLSDEAYVDTLYRTFFDREPDEGGKAGWLDELANGTSRKDVLDGFLGAQEFENLKKSFGV